MNLNLKIFNTFIEVAECGNMLRAAKELGIEQSQVSRDISKLEQAFKCTLLRRHRDGSELTPEGVQVLVKAKKIVGILTQKS